jgi:hypothetical protein
VAHVTAAPPTGRLRRAARAPEAPLLALIVVGAGVLRLWGLSRVGFRGDEAVYAGQSGVLAGVDEMKRYFILASRGNSNFLLFQELVSLVYRVVGVSDVAARAVAAVMSSLTVAVTFAIGRVLYDRRVALWAAAFLAVSSYSVALGRLALLDSTLTFFFALTVLLFVQWHRTGRDAWLYGFAAALALALQAKVLGVLVLAVAGGYVLLVRPQRWPSRRGLLVAAAVFLVALVPVYAQLLANGDEIVGFLGSSTGRSSSVPWYYYGRVLVDYEGPVMVVAWAVGIGIALWRRSKADVAPLVWVTVVLAFHELYPLKAFNYLLPAVPALSLLAARGVTGWSTARVPARLASLGLPLVLVVAAVPSLAGAVEDDSSAGLREAAHWLEENTAPDAGVMTLSKGSAQYVFGFYGRRDGYPFGRFRLATVLPGGEVVEPHLSKDETPRDWVTFRPEELIAEGRISYLVYQTGSLDDPPEGGALVQTSTERRFRDLIERYGGELVHTVYWHHEARAFVYEVTKRLPAPRLRSTASGGRLHVEGEGYTFGSRVTAYYHRRALGSAEAGDDGTVSLVLPRPSDVRPRYRLLLSDDTGTSASITGFTGRTGE